MNTQKYVTAIVALVVGVVIVMATLPIFSESTDMIDNVHYNGGNEYCVRMTYGTPSEDLYFTKPAGEMYVECRTGSLTNDPYYVAPLNSVGQMGWVLCTSSYSFGITGYGPQPIDYTSKYNNQGASGYTDVANTYSAHLNVTTGKMETWSTDPNNTWKYYDTVDMEHVFWADPNGDYINVQIANANYPTYIENPKSIAGSSQTQANYVFYYDTDHVSVTNNKPAVISTVTTENRGLYKLTSVPMNITGLNDSENNVTSAHVIVKYKVQGEPFANSESLNEIISVIPILLVTSLVVGSVAMFIIKRRD